MEYEVRDARDGIRAHWFVSNGVLIIEVSPELDRFSRQQYVEQAKAEHGIETRRRGLLPLPLLGGGHAAGHSKLTATTTAVGGGAIAVSVAAALVLPVALDHGSQSHRRRPYAAAPTRPTGPPRHPAVKPPEKTPPGKAPARPGNTHRPAPPNRGLLGVQTVDLPSAPQHVGVGTTPVVDRPLPPIPAPPRLPKPPTPPSIPPTRTRPLLRVNLPPIVNASVRLSPLQVHLQPGTGLRAALRP